MFGMVLIVGLTLFLMWRVYIHHRQAGGEDDEPSVIASVRPNPAENITSGRA